MLDTEKDHWSSQTDVIEKCVIQLSVLGVFLFCVFPYLDWIRRFTDTATGTFYAVFKTYVEFYFMNF